VNNVADVRQGSLLGWFDVERPGPVVNSDVDRPAIRDVRRSGTEAGAGMLSTSRSNLASNYTADCFNTETHLVSIVGQYVRWLVLCCWEINIIHTHCRNCCSKLFVG